MSAGRRAAADELIEMGALLAQFSAPRFLAFASWREARPGAGGPSTTGAHQGRADP
jgi:hypothetical protein